MEDQETSGEDLIDQEDPYPDGNPEQMAQMQAKISETGPFVHIEITEQQDSEPADQGNSLKKYIAGAVLIFVAITSLFIFIVAISEQKSQLPPSVPSCPPDWIGFQGMCYYFSKEKGNWTFSQNFCSSQNAFLLHFNPSQEKSQKDFVMRYKGKAPFWIGLRREPNLLWKWTNGENSTLEITGEEHCVFLNDEATLTSSRCATELFWICSKAQVECYDDKE